MRNWEKIGMTGKVIGLLIIVFDIAIPAFGMRKIKKKRGKEYKWNILRFFNDLFTLIIDGGDLLGFWFISLLLGIGLFIGG
jgi:hypothetical protein